MRNRKSIDLLAVLIAAMALATILIFAVESAPPVDRKLHAEIGRALAREALSLLGPGGQITVITRDLEGFRQPALEILIKTFRQQVSRGKDVKVLLQTVQSDPIRPVEVPPGDFYEAIRRSNAESVIVSLLGPPVLTEEQLARLGRVKPKIVAFCSGNLAEVIDLRQLFKGGLLRVALVNRRAAFTSSAAKRTNSMEELYTLVRAEEALAPAVSAADGP